MQYSTAGFRIVQPAAQDEFAHASQASAALRIPSSVRCLACRLLARRRRGDLRQRLHAHDARRAKGRASDAFPSVREYRLDHSRRWMDDRITRFAPTAVSMHAAGATIKSVTRTRRRYPAVTWSSPCLFRPAGWFCSTGCCRMVRQRAEPSRAISARLC